MTSALCQQFQHLVSARTGLHIRPREREAFMASIHTRMKALKLRRPEEYYRLLESSTAHAEQEWPELASRLTNRESYFFRDKGQMALLRERILPELIERNSARRSLRLWSAGCSTGEEAYSLAMLVEELLPRRNAWQLFILGTDLSPKSLAQAKRGMYGAWSFRMVEPTLKSRYFRPVPNGWEIAESVRKLVTFATSNLARDPFPDQNSGRCEMDLILCRNVFIYFERQAVPAVVRKLARTLRNGGYLITGHAEIEPPPLEELQSRRFPESLVYQRAGHETADDDSRPAGGVLNVPEAMRPPSRPLDRQTSPAGERCVLIEPPIFREAGRPAPISEAAVPPVPETAAALYARGDYPALIARLEPLLQRQPDDYPALYLLAQAYTNQGQHAQAVALCRRASELNPLAVAPYQLLAALVEDRGDYKEAKRLLKNVVYLSPASAVAYAELGALYAREGERERAKTMWTTALELLRGLPPDAVVEPWGGEPAGAWVRHVEGRLADGA